MTKGLLVGILENKHIGNCSNNGMSSKYTKAVLTGPGIPEIFSPSDDAPEVQLLPANIGPGFKVVPAEHGKGCGPMFGGCFVYTSDGRFPSDHPIDLHDRWESPELNEILSR